MSKLQKPPGKRALTCARTPPARSPARTRARPAGGGKTRLAEPQDGRNTQTGRFLPGHRFWETRASSGPAPKFADADALWKACVEYFCWVEANPLQEMQLVTFQGFAREYPVAKMRAMTIRALCRFLGIAHTTWSGWKKDRPDLASEIERVEAVIWEQKFTGAAAGLLNANIIARDLGLADKTEHTGEGGGPIKTEDLSPRAPSKERLDAILARYGVPAVPAAAGVGEGEARAQREGKMSDKRKLRPHP